MASAGKTVDFVTDYVPGTDDLSMILVELTDVKDSIEYISTEAKHAMEALGRKPADIAYAYMESVAEDASRAVDTLAAILRRLSDMDTFSLGQAAAHMFYHGYLEDVAYGEENMLQRMSDCVDRDTGRLVGHDLCILGFGILFILLPQDGDVELRPEDNVVDTTAFVPPITIDRAGVKSRQMGRHTFYRMDVEGIGPVAVAMEFATPLRTMSRRISPADMPSEVDKFHLTLLEIIDPPDRFEVDGVAYPGVILIKGATREDTLENLRVKLAEMYVGTVQ